MTELHGLNIDLDLLRTFWCVAQAPTITEAAARVGYGMTRSTVSRQLQTLEDQLGFPLLEARKSVRLTEPGARLFRRLEKVLPDLAEDIFALRDAHAPKLSLGGAAVFAQAHWPVLFDRIRKFEPRIAAHVVSDTEENLLAAVQQGRLQIIILPLHHPLPPHLCRRPLAALRLALLVPKDCPRRAAEELKAHERIPCHVALPETSPTVILELKKHLRRLGLKIQSAQSCALLDVLHFVASGAGIGLSLMEPGLITHPNVRAIPLEQWPPIAIGAIWRAPGTALEKHVVALLAARARELWPRRETRRA